MLKGEVLTGEGTSAGGSEAGNADASNGNSGEGLQEAIEKFKKDSKVWVESIEKGAI